MRTVEKLDICVGSLVRWGPEAAKQVRSVRAMLCPAAQQILAREKPASKQNLNSSLFPDVEASAVMESRRTSRKGRTLGPGHRIQRGQSEFWLLATAIITAGGLRTGGPLAYFAPYAATKSKGGSIVLRTRPLTASDFCSRRHESETDGDHGPPRRRRARPDPTDDVRDPEAPRARPRQPPPRESSSRPSAQPSPAPEKKVDGHARRLSQLQGHTCLVLNADWQPLELPPAQASGRQDAAKAAWQERVHVVSSYDVRSASASFAIPSVVVLRNYEKRGAEKAWFSKRLMMLRDGYRCQYCKDSFPPSLLTCDHVVLRAYGRLVDVGEHGLRLHGLQREEGVFVTFAAQGRRHAAAEPARALGLRARGRRAGLAVHNLLRKKNVHRGRSTSARRTSTRRWRRSRARDGA